MTAALPTDRPTLVRRGLWLNYLTIGYNAVEVIISIAAGVVSGSVALVSFGVDSGIEVTSSVAAHWRLRSDPDPERRERVERLTYRIIGWSFLALGGYVLVESVTTLWQREAPEASRVGLAILTLSILIMPATAHAAGKSAVRLGAAP
jgi:divalent metal cation (Fe/Co/Zn/Cd) transporter